MLKVCKSQSVRKMFHVQSLEKSNRVKVIKIRQIRSGKMVLKS